MRMKVRAMKPVLSFAVAAAFLGSANLASAATHANHSPTGSTAERTQTGQPMANANQFASESEARSHCRGETVVWANTKTHVYHFAGNTAYGHTKHGAFMCRADADRTGKLRAAKNEPPAAGAGEGSTTQPRR